MADRCPHCGAALPMPSPDSCPACARALAVDTGITANPAAGVDGSFAEPPLPHFEEDTPTIVKAEATGPSCPALLLIALSTFLCAAQGAGWSGLGRFSFLSDEVAFGAIVGLLVGLALAVDHWMFQRKLNRPTLIPGEHDPPPAEPAGPPPPPAEWVSIAMLVLPIVAGVITFFGATLRISETHLALIGSGAIVATAILGYFSIRQLALRMDRTVTYQGAFVSPAYTYLAMLAFWIIAYPAHFFYRRRMGGMNLILPGLIATAVYCAPIAQAFLGEAELPTADDPQIVALVKQLLEQNLGVRPADLKNAVQVSFDEARQQRVCRCMLATKRGDEPVDYTIDWQNRARGIWQVQIPPILPAVDSKEAIKLLEELFAPVPVNIVNPMQTGYDHEKQKRTGWADAVAGNERMRISYTVEWDNRNAGSYRVNILP